MDALKQLDPTALQLLLRHNLWQPLVRAEVVAEAVAGETLSAEEASEALEHQSQRAGLADAEAIAAHLQHLGLSEADWQWQAELPYRIRAFCNRSFRPKAEARFLERKDQLDRVVYSLLRVQDPYLARELYLRISGGEANFADLAQQYSEGPERSTKGIVGPVPLTQAHPALAERLRTSSPGVLQEPFQISEWWLVTRLENYTPARFEEAIADQMTGELFELWVTEQTRARMTHQSLATASTLPPTA